MDNVDTKHTPEREQTQRNEKTCTLGWAQNYGNEARKLCQMILKEDPGAFSRS